MRVLIVTLLLTLVHSHTAFAKWHKAEAPIMGTNIVVEVWSEQDQLGRQATATVLREMERINQLMSPYIPSSELSQVNQHAAVAPVRVSKEMFDLVANAIDLSIQTRGAFDITFASVGFLYDYRERVKPKHAEIDSLLASISYRHLRLDPEALSIAFANPDVKIDLGGIAKGHAVDNAITLLREMGIEHALVTAGGDTRLLGDRHGRPWMVGIRDPRNQARQAVVMPLEEIALSTSGDYERYFEEDGERYHHILSPKTGKSANGVQSVSILGPSSTQNDGLSTAVFVLGVEEGLALINRIANVDAIIVDGGRKLHYSNDLYQ